MRGCRVAFWQGFSLLDSRSFYIVFGTVEVAAPACQGSTFAGLQGFSLPNKMVARGCKVLGCSRDALLKGCKVLPRLRNVVGLLVAWFQGLRVQGSLQVYKTATRLQRFQAKTVSSNSDFGPWQTPDVRRKQPIVAM